MSDDDFELFDRFGTDLTAQAEKGTLPRAFGLESLCDEVCSTLVGRKRSSAVLVGPSGCGKTALVGEVVYRLKDAPGGPWMVWRVSPSEMMAGTRYLGELETRVHALIEAVRAPRRVILYVPNIEALSDAGRHSKSDMNIGTALAPFIADGSVIVIGETTPEIFHRGLGGIGYLRRLFRSINVPAADAEMTRRILGSVQDQSRVKVSEDLLARLVELSEFYLPGSVQPGRAVALFRAVLNARPRSDVPLVLRDVLSTLSRSTGIPAELLDDQVRLDLAVVRTFFETRVMGQPEALAAVLDLVTLIKAGLTDPQKPLGVFLFVGPTGVGKTELARSLAEFIFGDASRLVRLDMSEFATYEAYERLIGTEGRTGLLTSVVQEKPFSVILLDEIEKAHLNVFDLCLQIFDAGRLTDVVGRTVDFRRTIIILTSNVGAPESLDSGIGFGTADHAHAPTTGLKELSQFFRPEFLNRLDRIVAFQPLSIESVEKIARRELRGESGLHQFVWRRRESKRSRSEDREVVRVDVLPAAGGGALRRSELRVDVRPLRQVRGRLLERPRLAVELFHEESLTSLRAWTRGPRNEAVEKLGLLLLARVEAGRGAAAADAPIIRRYTFGATPKVRDFRTGQTTSKLDRVLEGDLGGLLLVPDEGTAT